MIEVREISKRYVDILALNKISFTVDKGELFGIIGPDGAGKTTLFRILATLLLPDDGSALVNDWDVIKQYKKIRKNIGYMPGRFSLYQDLSVQENLEFFASIFHTSIKNNYENIQTIYEQIAPFKNRKAGALSGGMKQKLALCCALVHNPEVLFLDEPTTGVDAVSRQEFWESLIELKNKGMTILVSTPYMDEASLCDRVALMQTGRIMEINAPEAIIHKFSKKLWAIKADNTYRLLKDLQSFQHIDTCFPFGENIHVTLLHGEADMNDLRKYLQEKQHQELTITTILPVIEDCFMDLMTEDILH
jgi:ABC-type multidrug transport system ATPase subunit